MRYIAKFNLLLALLPFISGCVYEFDPTNIDVPGEDGKMLVIEGDIIAGGITQVSVSYTTKVLDYEESWVWIQGVSVWVENEAGEIWGSAPPEGVQDTSSYRVIPPYLYQIHKIDTRGLPLDAKYRLCVSIPGRGEYMSSFSPVIVTPPIDSITWSVSPDSLQAFLEVTTHDNRQQPGYYRWFYRENWDNSPDIIPNIRYNHNLNLMERYTEEQKQMMQHCLGESYSSGILVASTEKLDKNHLNKQRIMEISSQDKRVKGLYCITVIQTAMDKQGYAYWESIRKNTTGMGGLFDPQPSEINGNITSLANPDETVIGYINVCTASVGRRFIDWEKTDIYDRKGCMNMVMYPEAEWRILYENGKVPVYYGMTESGFEDMGIAAWVDKKCVETGDCFVAPPFWPKLKNVE